MTKLLEFLTDLAANPRKQSAFAQTPTAVIEAAGLTEAERAVLESRNSTRVAAAFADELVPVAIAFREPDPDPSPDPDPLPDPDPDSDPLEDN